MSKFSPHRLDVKTFAESGSTLEGSEPLGQFERLLAETQGRGADVPVRWSANGELRNPLHVNPQVWLQLEADALLSLTCQRCLNPVDVQVKIDRLFRFVTDEVAAAAEDDESEEDVLAISTSFDLMGLLEDELLMEMPLSPRHEACPPVRMEVADADFEQASTDKENPFSVLSKLKGARNSGEH